MADQRTIGEWHERTFGDCDPSRIGRKLLEEAAELTVAIKERGYADCPDVRGEIADVAIALAAIAHRCGVDIQDCVAEKFKRVEKKYAGHG